MASIFSKIANREIPGYFVAEDKDFFAILDIFPLQKGHTLVIPKQEVDHVFELDDDAYAAYHQFAKKVGEAIGQAFPCERVGMAVVGLEVPHAHIHLIPINRMADMDFAQPKLKLSESEFKACAEAIVEKLNGYGQDFSR